MRQRLSDYFWRGVTLLGVLFLLYVIGYLALQRRVEFTICDSVPTPQGMHTDMNVALNWKGGRAGLWLGLTFYRHVYWIDARYFRRHYWSPYSLDVTPGRTNVTYVFDQKDWIWPY